MDDAVVVHVKLGALAVELGLRDVARVREPARVLKRVASIEGMYTAASTSRRNSRPKPAR